VGQEAVQRSDEKLHALKSAVDQALATFEDYYGTSERLAALPTMEEMAAQEANEAEAAKKREEEKAMFSRMMSGARISDSPNALNKLAINTGK